jgi:hypothetical protein
MTNNRAISTGAMPAIHTSYCCWWGIPTLRSVEHRPFIPLRLTSIATCQRPALGKETCADWRIPVGEDWFVAMTAIGSAGPLSMRLSESSISASLISSPVSASSTPKLRSAGPAVRSSGVEKSVTMNGPALSCICTRPPSPRAGAPVNATKHRIDHRQLRFTTSPCRASPLAASISKGQTHRDTTQPETRGPTYAGGDHGRASFAARASIRHRAI